MKLETERLILRNALESDAEEVFAYSRHPEVGKNAGWKPHESLEETKEIMKTVFVGQKDVFLIILRESGKVIGSAGLLPDQRREGTGTLMLGYALGYDYWGRGIMSEACRAVIEYAFNTLGEEYITAFTYPGNRRSRRVLEKLGFRHEGTLTDCEKLYDGKIVSNECYLLTSPDCSPSPREFRRGETVMHFKRLFLTKDELVREPDKYLYEVLGEATDAGNGATLMIYRALYGEGKVFVRPFDEFVSAIDEKSYPEAAGHFRFEKVCCSNRNNQ